MTGLTEQGLRLLEDDDRPGAIVVLERAVAAGEHAAPRALAQALVQSNRYEDACAVLTTAVDTGRTDLLCLLGGFAATAELTDLADDAYRKAVAAGDPEARNDYGAFLSDQERYDEAIAMLTAAIAAGDELAPANLVRLYADDLDDLDTALELGRRYLDEAKPTTYSALALVHEFRGELDEAQRLYLRAIELGAPGAHVLMGEFLWDCRSDLAGAEREFRLAYDHDEEGWGHQLGALLLETGRRDEALDILHHAASWGDREATRLRGSIPRDR